MTAAEQYSQSCFEGSVAMVNEKGEITLFRPEENAKKLQKSCEALMIPPPSREQILESIKVAVLANKEFLPKPGSDAKLYIRPYVKGLNGGSGVGPADSYAFAVEVFPFGNYLGDINAVLDLGIINGKRRSSENGHGSDKVSANYAAPIFKAKKHAMMDTENPINDIMFLGLQTEEKDIDGKQTLISREVVDEASAANTFFISTGENNEICIHTPPLDRKAILPGITRKSVLKIAEKLGYSIKEEELTLKDLEQMDGAFLSGSAAGIVRVGSIKHSDGKLKFDNAPNKSDKSTKTTEVFFKIYNALYAARKGELDKFFPKDMQNWATVIGAVKYGGTTVIS